MQQKSNINPVIYQQFLESASNAAEKGQAQWETPVEWAEVLSLPLPRFRPVIVDLNCGSGRLLDGASRASTNHRLGCDIDPGAPGQINERIAGDVCKLFPLLKAVRWEGDAFCLNPPWDLHWYRAALKGLLESDLPTVRSAMEAWDGRTSKECIDSTIATLCLALDLSSEYGEGLLIANEATVQRLIFQGGAPHCALASHVWAHLVIKGNPMTGIQDCAHQEGEQFTTGVLYFARSHDTGPPAAGSTLYAPPLVSTLDEAKAACTELQRNRLDLRMGPEIKNYAHTEDSPEKWKAVQEEWERLTRKDKPQWNISLHTDGTIKTDLSLYDTKSCRVTKKEAESLFALGGQHPMQLVMQRQQRAHLEKAAFGKTWRVDPKLQAAIKAAVAEYYRVRAPLYALSPIQRLGFLDESDFICCYKDLGGCFKADHAYPLRSCTIAVKRSGEKLNLCGELDSVEWDSSELAFYITDDSGREKVFMEARLRADNVKLSVLKSGDRPTKQDHDCAEACAVDFSLQQLVEHFLIPEVPDVAKVNPEGYQRNLRRLEEIELLCGVRLKPFQKHDLARAALHDGLILGWQTGLGKTLALYLWALLKVGTVRTDGAIARPLCPSEAVLLVAPHDLHKQICEEGKLHFGVMPIAIDSQKTFLKLSSVSPTGRRVLAPGFYLTTFTQLSRNGVTPFPELQASEPERMMQVLNLSQNDVVEFFNERGPRYAKHYSRLYLTPESTIADLNASWFRERKHANQYRQDELDESYYLLKNFAPRRLRNGKPAAFEELEGNQQSEVIARLVEVAHKSMSENIGESRYKQKMDRDVKCVYSPTLADLCADSFACVAIDEGVKIKGEDTLVGMNMRQLSPKFRLILTATPVKNRFPDLFRLAHWVTGGHHRAHPRFPFGDDGAEEFAIQFSVSERNLSAEERSESGRKFVKLTPQVCSIHRVWKLFAPIILRRRKVDCGEQIVKMTRHVIRVPMGRAQAEAYRYHLEAKYHDKNGRPAIGAQLQALRLAASDPSSDLLRAVAV